MGTILTNLLSGGIEGAGKGIATVIDSIRGKSPEDAVKLAQLAADTEALKLKYPAEFEIAKIGENVQLNTVAGENIRAETTSDDKYTKRSRPTIVYVGVFVILMNYGLAPFWQLVWRTYSPINMPETLWWIWGTIVTGYVINRSAEKVAQMPGDSRISLAKIFTIGQKN